jgi:uncharacterized Zn-finger protein
MNKYFTLFIIALIALLGCEQDSICIDATTPSMIIRFYDINNPTETKAVELDSIWVEGKNQYIKNVTTDSIAIFLDINENETLYNFSSENIVDKINFTYNRNDVFVGRSCGYKTIYENLQIGSETNNWIKNIEIINTIIENDTAAQVYIFH